MSGGAEFWVFVAFIVFCGILLRLGVHHRIVEALDGRQTRIRSQLDEARRLRDEAEAVLKGFLHRRSEVEAEAGAIIAAADAEADRLVAEAKAKMENYVARRTKLMETRISGAEANALAEVRAAAVDAAVAVAEKILINALKRDGHQRVMTRSIADVRARFTRPTINWSDAAE
jgi:F-type H+-transporting ATPase subunit b